MSVTLKPILVGGWKKRRKRSEQAQRKESVCNKGRNGEVQENGGRGSELRESKRGAFVDEEFL